jgi:hypothetical protein
MPQNKPLQVDEENAATAIDLYTYIGVPGRGTVTGLVLRPDLDFDAWLVAVKKLTALSVCFQFAVGDAILYGEKAFGRRAYSEAERVSGFARTTLYAYARIAERVPPSVRSEAISFSHHAAVEQLHGLPNGEELQRKWLKEAFVKKMTTAHLRRAVRSEASMGLLPGDPEIHPQPANDILSEFFLTVMGKDQFGSEWRGAEMLKEFERVAAGYGVSPEELARKIITDFMKNELPVSAGFPNEND